MQNENFTVKGIDLHLAFYTPPSRARSEPWVTPGRVESRNTKGRSELHAKQKAKVDHACVTVGKSKTVSVTVTPARAAAEGSLRAPAAQTP